MIRVVLLCLTVSIAIFANMQVVVSIAPEEYFAKAVSGYLDATVMVTPGSSPHTYEPKPSQMKKIAKADLYLAIGVEFESVWLNRFADLNPGMKIVDISENIARIPIAGAKGAKKGKLDPHIWTSPSNVKIIATNIADAFMDADPKNEKRYRENLNRFLKSVDELDAKIREKLSRIPEGSTFMVFHPAWGYFAREYGLKQLPVEIEGKEPKPKELAKLIDKARKKGVKAIIVQPEFSDKSARLIAGELKIPVVKISPLEADWYDTLLRLAECISKDRAE